MAAVSDVRRRRLALAGAVVGVVFVVGVLVANLGRGSSAPKPTGEPIEQPQPAVASGSEPTAEVAGTATGFTRDGDGAVQAAVAYATASQRWLYFSDDEIRAAMAQIAAPASVDRLATDVVADVSVARERLGASSGRVWWLVRPLAWELEFHNTDKARVSVWVVTVLSAAEVAAPQSEWMTVTLDLAWVDGGWRVDAVRDTPGPTPMVGPGDRAWDAMPFDEALAGFTRMDGEPVL